MIKDKIAFKTLTKNLENDRQVLYRYYHHNRYEIQNVMSYEIESLFMLYASKRAKNVLKVII